MGSGETPPPGLNPPEKDQKDEVYESPEINVPPDNDNGDDDDDDSVIDVSGKILDFPAFNNNNGGDDIIRDNVEGCYVYKNLFNLIPRSVGRLGKLKTLKFFANDINLFPAEFRNLAELESLQVKISAPGLRGLKLDKLKSLKELELSKAPPRPSAFHILREIAGLKLLTRLAVCHFSIRYLPPEIGCLNNLEYLDLSFNKMRSLPTEITFLNNLIALKIANNKLVDLPTSFSSLQKLNDLDLSNNRLSSLGCLELGSMHNLQSLNLQCNKLPSSCQIPSWMRCNLEGNAGDALETDFPSCSVEMDVLSSVQEIHVIPRDGASTSSSSYFIGSPSSSRSFASRKSGKGWKRRCYYQQRARQERLNSSRKWKAEDSADGILKTTDKCKLSLVSESSTDAPSATVDPLIDGNEILSRDAECEEPLTRFGDNSSRKKCCKENCSLIALESVVKRTDESHECTKNDSCLEFLSNVTDVPDESSSLEASNINSKSKRHPEKDLDNPKPRKARRSFDMRFNLSSKYNKLSFCSIEDHLPDGFYDAGRDRPFMPLSSYEQNLHINSREVILLDRESDEELDAITLCAQALVSQFKQINGSSNKREQSAIDDLQVASLLALFVSDHFGGSDKSAMIERARKAVSGSNYMKPFVCTCRTGNSESIRKPLKDGLDSVQDIVVQDLCEKSLQSIKTTQNSIIAPIGALRFGVCRHRALLLKYLCDRMEPQVPCELVRGYLDFYPHAWNVIVTKKGDSWVRMIVDACRPHDIRTETDEEYLCRYIPLSCVDISITGEKNLGPRCSFPSMSSCDEIGKAGSTKLIRCNLGSIVAAAKVRTIDVCGTSAEEIKNFELNCLGEVRILRALENSCIIKLYGHQISSKWTQSSDKKPECRTLQSAILMEYLKGGSLKDYLQKLFRAGEKHVQTELALNIARDVAHALLELHSKDIIHRDIKSENILIDLDSEREDGTPVVKLCDFDRAIPLRSFLHSCCISHNGIPPPDICVGTPRWMAPEVFRTMHKRELYGLEVDIWSFGCLLLELLTLEVPYSGVPEPNIHDHLQVGKRPPLTDELEALTSEVDPTMVQPGAELEDPKADTETLKFLIGLYRQCTEENPTDRPTAETLYKILLMRTNCLSRSRKLEQE